MEFNSQEGYIPNYKIFDQFSTELSSIQQNKEKNNSENSTYIPIKDKTNLIQHYRLQKSHLRYSQLTNLSDFDLNLTNSLLITLTYVKDRNGLLIQTQKMNQPDKRYIRCIINFINFMI
ncbi:hypothetical protein pb186bvf_002839 [Paramecium bursaria]